MIATVDRAGPAACPACEGGALAAAPAPRPTPSEIVLSLPGIHCAGCIAGVERALHAQPGVTDARVNLTLRRATVSAAPGVAAGDLVGALDAAGYEAHELDATALTPTEADRRGRDLLMRLAVAAFASMNVMLLSVAVWSGADGATRDMFHWISAAITLPAIAFCAQPFLASAARALRGRRLNMDVPISLAIVLAVGTSLSETIQSGAHAYFDAAIMLTAFLLAGRWLDHRTRASARSAAQELAALEVARALRITPDGPVTVEAQALAVGDRVLVRPGGRVPVDGAVVEGRSELDRSVMTGESLPAPVGPGGAVTAGEVNLTGPLTVRVTASGRDTALHRMADLVAVAEAGRANYTPLADRAARLYAPGVHIVSALAAVGWWLGTGDLRVALNIAAAVLIITCPCALGLAVPAVTTAASGRLFRRGLLIKDATAMERLAEADTIVFDKTGTLTLGAPRPLDPGALSGGPARVALALARASAHPLAQALVPALEARGIVPAKLDDVAEVAGHGVQATWRGMHVRLGRAEWVGAEPSGHTATYLRLGGQAARAIPFADSPRPGAADLVATLLAQGKRVIVLSGDGAAAVGTLADELGVAEWHAGCLPHDKAARIAALQQAGARVLMVGDGLNDTAALAGAHVSISPASALDAARTASDMVLLGRDLAPVADAIRVAGRARRRIAENFTIATVYNLVAVPVAVAGLATPLVAAAAMSLSSITVSLNAMRVS